MYILLKKFKNLKYFKFLKYLNILKFKIFTFLSNKCIKLLLAADKLKL
jgi:hypothetical protein